MQRCARVSTDMNLSGHDCHGGERWDTVTLDCTGLNADFMGADLAKESQRSRRERPDRCARSSDVIQRCATRPSMMVDMHVHASRLT
jgi:hypothetical protein